MCAPTVRMVPSVTLLPQSRERLQEFHRALQVARDDRHLQAALKAASFEHLCEHLARLREQAEPLRERMFYRPTYQPAKRRRKPGGGRKPRLTTEEIARGRGLYQGKLNSDPAYRKQASALAFLLPKFNASKSTLLRHIIRPMLENSK